MTREICKACWRINPVGFWVPDEIWKASVPDNFQLSILCIMCFARFADENFIEWDNDIEFFPVAYTTHRIQEKL